MVKIPGDAFQVQKTYTLVNAVLKADQEPAYLTLRIEAGTRKPVSLLFI